MLHTLLTIYLSAGAAFGVSQAADNMRGGPYAGTNPIAYGVLWPVIMPVLVLVYIANKPWKKP